MNRFPDLAHLTAGGRGVPMLAANYGATNGLEVVVRVPEYRHFPTDAEERRDAFLVSDTELP